MLRKRFKTSGHHGTTSMEPEQKSTSNDEEKAAQSCSALLRDFRESAVQDSFEEGANYRAVLNVSSNPAVFLHNAFQPVIVILFLVVFLGLVGVWMWIGAIPRSTSVSEKQLRQLYHQVIQRHPLLIPPWVGENEGGGQEPGSELGEIVAVRLCSSRHGNGHYKHLEEAQEAWLAAGKNAGVKVPRLQIISESVEALFALERGDISDVTREVVDSCSMLGNDVKRGNPVSSETGLRVLRKLESVLKDLCQGGVPCLTSETGEKRSLFEWTYFIILGIPYEASHETRVLVSTGVGAAVWVPLEGTREVVHVGLKEGFGVVIRTWFKWSVESEATISWFLKAKCRLRFFLGSAGDYKLDWDFQDLQRRSLASFLNALKSVMHLSMESEIVTDKNFGMRSWDAGAALVESNRTEALWIVPETFMQQLPQLSRRWTSAPVATETRVGHTGMWHCGFWWNPPGAPAVRFPRKGGASGTKAVTLRQWGVLAAGMSVPRRISGDTKQSAVSMGSDMDSVVERPWEGGRKEWIVSHEEFAFVTRLWVARIRSALGLPGVSVSGHIRQEQRWGDAGTEESWGNVTRGILRVREYGVVTGYEQSQRMYSNGSTLQQVVVEIPAATGLTDWEIRKLQRAALRVYVFQTLRHLRGLARILKSQPQLVVMKSAAQCTQRAFQMLESVSRRTADSVSERVLIARSMAQVADECLFHNTVTGELYFPPEFVVAVYLPLLLPIGVSITVASLRLIKRHVRMRAKD